MNILVHIPRMDDLQPVQEINPTERNIQRNDVPNWVRNRSIERVTNRERSPNNRNRMLTFHMLDERIPQSFASVRKQYSTKLIFRINRSSALYCLWKLLVESYFGF